MANNATMKFNDWVNMQRGRSLAVARHLGVTQPVVSDWCTGQKAIAAIHCKAIEAFSAGEVTCQEMRPTDWHKYWPELAKDTNTIAHVATESVAHTATLNDEAGALREGVVRRHANRRASDAPVDLDRRIKHGPPFQVAVEGVA